MKRLFVLPVAALACIGPVGVSSADTISKGCGDFERITEIASPVEKNIIDVKSSEKRPQDVRLVHIHRGEPVDAASWLLTFVDDRGEANCFLLHRKSEEDETEQVGYNDVRLDRAFYRENGQDGRIELFVPVTKFPSAGDEDHGARIIEINIGKDGVPRIIKD